VQKQQLPLHMNHSDKGKSKEAQEVMNLPDDIKKGSGSAGHKMKSN
jgi:hypothetical protein